jgi:hypothetical protein
MKLYTARRPTFANQQAPKSKFYQESALADPRRRYAAAAKATTIARTASKASTAAPVASGGGAPLKHYGRDDEDEYDGDAEFVTEASLASQADLALLEDAHGADFDIPFHMRGEIMKAADERMLPKGGVDRNTPMLHFVYSKDSDMITYELPAWLEKAFAEGQAIGLVRGMSLPTLHMNRATPLRFMLPDVRAQPEERGYGSGTGCVTAILPASAIAEKQGALSNVVICPERELSSYDVDFAHRFADFIADPAKIDEQVHETGDPNIRNVQCDSPIIDVHEMLHGPVPFRALAQGSSVMTGDVEDVLSASKEAKELCGAFSVFKGPEKFAIDVMPMGRVNAATKKETSASFFDGYGNKDDPTYSFSATGTLKMTVIVFG